MKIIHKIKDDKEVEKEGRDLLGKVARMQKNFRAAIQKKVDEYQEAE